MTVSAVGLKPTDQPDQARTALVVRHIMIVGDTPGGALMTEEMLRHHEPDVIVATCARVEDATGRLTDSRPDCVLLDLGLSDADDLDGLSQILDVAPGVPVVVLTDVDDDRIALVAVSRGAQDYVAKSDLAPPQLWRAINRAIGRARVTQELAHDAHHDSLTGLPNRALFERRLAQTLKRSARLETGFSVMLIGIDDLKSLNDNFGHALGDEVLREISRRLTGGLDDGDTAYRFAGAEFAVICQTAEHPVGATSIAEWIRDSIRQPIVVGVRSLNIGTSIGVAIASVDETTATLLHRLDGASYEARLTGGACVVD
jgi:diguanylate cyclase (GGDEF)-like protein